MIPKEATQKSPKVLQYGSYAFLTKSNNMSKVSTRSLKDDILTDTLADSKLPVSH